MKLYSRPALLLTVLGATLAMAADAAGPAAPALRQTLVAKNGVRVDLPWSKNWEVRTQADIPDNTVSFTSKTDPSGFAVLVTPVPEQKGELATDKGMREITNRTIAALASQSVENPLVAQPLVGGSLRGYYVHATDKAPKPGEFKYLETVILGFEDVPVMATILFSDSGEQDAAQARAALANLKLTLP